MSGRPQPGDPDFPYMLADTPEEFERVRRAAWPAPSPARGGPDSGHMCICTTPERQSGRYFRACPAHERPATSGVCHHTADEGCNGHGDF